MPMYLYADIRWIKNVETVLPVITFKIVFNIEHSVPFIFACLCTLTF